MSNGERLTAAQRRVLDFLANGPISYVSYYAAPGAERNTKISGFFWRCKGEAPKPDARTINPLIDREFLKYVGDGDYEITEAGRRALEDGK
jgi:hypothetical protein